MNLNTVVAVPVTPFAPDGRIDEDRYVALLDRLTGGGIEVLTPNGNTGEFYALTGPERRRVVELTVGRGATVLAGVGLDLTTAIADARTAADLGADAVMVHQPVHPFRSSAGWLAYHREIAAAVPALGVVPYVKDPTIDAATLSALVAGSPNVVAVKYAIPDPQRAAALATSVPGITWICGVAEAWAPFFAAAGSTAFTSGLATVCPALSLRLHSALVAGDRAGALACWQELRAFEELRARNNSEHNVLVVKEALHQLDLCAPDVRPPCTRLPAADRELVTDILRAWGEVLSPRSM